MSADPAGLAAVGEVRRVLESVLSNFETRTPEVPAIDAALVEVTTALGRWGELRGGRTLEELDPEVRAALEPCRRLHAVVLTLLAGRRAELAQERSLVQRARRHLAELERVVGSGGSCDVAG